MNHHLIAKVALSVLLFVQAVATVVIDFNRTHATNPSWTGHARFHLVWQSVTVVLMSLLGFVLVCNTGPYESQRFYLGALLAPLSPLSFLIAFFSRRVFGGTLYDQNGIPPVHLNRDGSGPAIDLNLVAVVGALALLLAIIWIFRW